MRRAAIVIITAHHECVIPGTARYRYIMLVIKACLIGILAVSCREARRRRIPMKQRSRKTTQHAPHALTERDLRRIGGGTLVQIPPPPMPEINRNLK